jgi:hypothetical protein
MMDSLAEAYVDGRKDAVARVLGDAVSTLRQGGDYGAAASLQDVVNTLYGRPCELHEAVPGLRALLRLADRERHDPAGMLPGEHVRLVFGDQAAITGVWRYDEPTDEWSAGRAYIVRDDNGEEFDIGGRGMQIQPVWLDLVRRDKADALARAVTVIASGWAGRRALRAPDHDELIKHEHIDYEQDVDPRHPHRERQRRCECGELAELRVAAWAPAPSTDVVGDDDTFWSEPTEYAAATVCSADCAANWTDTYTASAVKLLSKDTVDSLRFSLARWSFEPAFEDLPGALAMAQEASESATFYVREAAQAWVGEQYDVVALSMNNARTSATIALARIAEAEPVDRGPIRYTAGDAEPHSAITVTTEAGHAYSNDPVHGLWLPNFRVAGQPSRTWESLLADGYVEAERLPEMWPSIGALHPRDVPVDVWLQMAAPLVAKILDDPHRYEVIDGGATVYDRQTNQHLDGRTGLHHPNAAGE